MHTRLMNTRENWNRAIDQRRSNGKPAFQKGDFDPKSPGYSLPLDILEHPTVQEVEQFFVDQRDEALNPEQLKALNGVQNAMREKLARFSCMHHDSDYRVVVPMNEYAPHADALDDQDGKSFAWKVVHVATTDYLNRAKAVLG